jgi:hypothetical protein
MRISARGLLILAFTIALSSMAPAAAVSILDLEIMHSKRTYLVAFDVLLDAEPADIRELLSDYRQWCRLSDTLIESQLLRTFPDGRQRLCNNHRYDAWDRWRARNSYIGRTLANRTRLEL